MRVKIEPYSPYNTHNHAISSSTECHVCGERAQHRHFGALACDACAAFFRRSIALGKAYRSCEHCDHRQQRPQAAKRASSVPCKYCRFQKCIFVGMRPSAVQNKQESSIESTVVARPVVPQPYTSPTPRLIDRFLIQRRMMHAFRSHYLRNKLQYPSYPLNQGSHNMVELQTINNFEMQSFRCYLSETNTIEPPERIDMLPHAMEMFLTWIVFETSMSNAVHNVQRGNQLYFLDGRYVECDVVGIERFYGSLGNIGDLECLARLSIPFFQVLGCILGGRIASSHLDEIEIAVLLHVVMSMIGKIPDLGTLPRDLKSALRRQRNIALRELGDHYRSVGVDVSDRMARIVGLVEPIQDVIRQLKEHLTLIQLHTQTQAAPTYAQILAAICP